MIQEFTEKQFCDKFTTELYHHIVGMAFKKVKESPEFLKGFPNLYSLQCYPLPQSKGCLIIECNAVKLTKAGTTVDFGIHKLYLSDEEMPDMALDRYNEYVKAKEKIDAENK